MAIISNFKKNRNKSISSKILFGLGGITVLVTAAALLIANVNIYKKKQQLNAQIKTLESRIESLKNENSSLDQRISNADDEDYIDDREKIMTMLASLAKVEKDKKGKYNAIPQPFVPDDSDEGIEMA